jgi:hypothetical protein
MFLRMPDRLPAWGSTCGVDPPLLAWGDDSDRLMMGLKDSRGCVFTLDMDFVEAAELTLALQRILRRKLGIGGRMAA